MLLCLDIGNTHIYGGIFSDDQLSFQFRYPSKEGCTSDEIGIFLRTYLREIGIEHAKIKEIAFCSVVPSVEYSIRAALIKYFSLNPFILQATHPALAFQIQYKNLNEIGMDRVANAIAARHYFPHQNLIVVDLGTATTFEAISLEGQFWGGGILPGLQMQMRALTACTSNLPPVSIVKVQTAVSQTTTANIQSGLYYGHLGAIREILKNITLELFSSQPVTIIGTGGFASLYENENLFNAIIPDLVLQGLRLAAQQR